MTAFSAGQQTAGTTSHPLMVERNPHGDTPHPAYPEVGAVRHGGTLSDLSREVAIQHEAREVEQCMRRYGETNCFSDRGAADRARLRMEELIKGRSAAQVERMERERGLR
jgi:hypothetical protein